MIAVNSVWIAIDTAPRCSQHEQRRAPRKCGSTLRALCRGIHEPHRSKDSNDAATLVDAQPVFIVVENLFCVYFSVELAIRFAAFRYKRNCMKDSWFVFDSVLVALMAS